MQAIEDQILYDLHHSEGHLLDNEKLVNALSESKLMSKMVLERLAESESTEKKILLTREQYRSVAKRGSLMYFLIIDLVYVDPMYSYSLVYFKKLFCNTISDAPVLSNLESR